MRIQLLSDLHLETEVFEPTPAPDAELLVLAGDVDSSWAGLEKFRAWPVPVLFVAGNHEFDGRELTQAWPELRARCTALGIRLLECESLVRADRAGRRVRFVATTRWSDFDLFGPAQRERAMRAGGHFVKIMRATRNGRVLDAAAVREEALVCGAWLRQELEQPHGDWEKTVVITHFAPSFRSADLISAATYGGNSATNQSEIGDGLTVAVDVPGANTGAGGARGLFTDSQTGADFLNHLISLRDDLRAGNPAAITADNKNFQSDENNVAYQVANNGVAQNRLTAAAAFLTSDSAAVDREISSQSGADLAQTIVALNRAQNGYQAALQSSVKIMQLSILNYIS